MAKSVNLGRNSKRASVLLKQWQKEWQKSFKECHGNPNKVKAAAKRWHDKYGATPKTRWKRALRDARKVGGERQTSMSL